MDEADQLYYFSATGITAYIFFQFDSNRSLGARDMSRCQPKHKRTSFGGLIGIVFLLKKVLYTHKKLSKNLIALFCTCTLDIADV
uniref:Uncharacterized protein n=1 Tax=Arundo donax TaxID=35708 RepID=A0A0A9GD17_ARUDO